jgi:streptogrisin C
VAFSTNLHGADGTQNYTWNVKYPGAHPCSTGASAEQVNGATYTAGFATAGHCGQTGDTIQSSDGTSLGSVGQSTFAIVNNQQTFYFNEDGGWVNTLSTWAPQPQINGYTNGTLNVSGTWAGMLVAPVGTTACRYGEASGGPHCASVSVLNEVVYISGFRFNGMIEVDGICTNDGDSGGPLVTPANQVQGTVTGGTANSCPDSSGDYVYFQPIATTLNRSTGTFLHPVAMLTSHGRTAPTVTISCPDPVESGAHTYQCDYSSYDSQGITTSSWTTNTGASSSTSFVSGTCTTGQTVNVSLALTNPYGTTTKNGSFLCPIGPIH